MMETWEKLAIGGVIVVLVLIGGFSFMDTYQSAVVSGECVKLGYPRYKLLIEWDGWHGYCVATINHTDVVVALEKAVQR